MIVFSLKQLMKVKLDSHNLGIHQKFEWFTRAIIQLDSGSSPPVKTPSPNALGIDGFNL